MYDRIKGVLRAALPAAHKVREGATGLPDRHATTFNAVSPGTGDHPKIGYSVRIWDGSTPAHKRNAVEFEATVPAALPLIHALNRAWLIGANAALSRPGR
jgi:hypothetical protein